MAINLQIHYKDDDKEMQTIQAHFSVVVFILLAATYGNQFNIKQIY